MSPRPHFYAGIRIGVALVCLFVFGRTCCAQQSSAIDELLPHIGYNTYIVVRFETSQISFPQLPASSGDEAYLRKIGELSSSFNEIRDVLDGKPVYVTVDIPVSKNLSPINIYFTRPSSAETLTRLTEKLVQINFSKPTEKGELLVSYPLDNNSQGLIRNTDDKISDQHASAISSSLNKVKGFPIQIALVPPRHVLQTYADLVTELPAALGGAPVDKLANSFHWMAIGIEPAEVKAQMFIKTTSPEAAKEVSTLLSTTLTAMVSELPNVGLGHYQSAAGTLLPLIRPTSSDEFVNISIDGSSNPKDGANLTSVVLRQIADPIAAGETNRKLRRIGLGIHNYASAMRTLPAGPNVVKDNIDKRLSWRVQILPFLGEVDLYNQFKMDEPWDSEHNAALLGKMPSAYRNSGIASLTDLKTPQPGYTTFVAPISKNTIFGYSEPVTFSKITDGTSNTIMVTNVAVDHAVPWTAPQDFEFNPSNPRSGLYLHANGQFMALFGDGSIQEVPATVSDEMIVHLFEMNDGNVVGW